MRAGTFSSSSAWKLMTKGKAAGSFGAPALKYIKQVNLEMKLGRALMCERDSRPTDWGDFCQHRVFNLLDLSYRNIDGVRYFHPDVKCWSGMPDTLRAESVGDIKSPYNLEVFCDKIEALEAGIEVYKAEFPEDYYQHISNAILLNANGIKVTHFEAIIYAPYRYEIDEIRKESEHEYQWIKFANDDELPWIPDGGQYKNLNIYRFEVPISDKIALHERVVEAGKQLIEVPKRIAV
jgi:hypothetical protein